MSTAMALRPIGRHRRMAKKIGKLSPKDEEKVQITLRMPKDLLRRVMSIGRAVDNDRTDVLLHFIGWGADEYEAEYGKPEQIDDKELVEPKTRRR